VAFLRRFSVCWVAYFFLETHLRGFVKRTKSKQSATPTRQWRRNNNKTGIFFSVSAASRAATTQNEQILMTMTEEKKTGDELIS